MADYQNNAGATRPQGKGARGRRRRPGGNNRGGFRNERENNDRGGFERREPRAPKPTGFQKFLSWATFGLLGKPASKPASSSRGAPQPTRTPREPGPIARADRADRAERQQGRESRPPKTAPVSEEVTTERLYVGNLSYDASESDLFELFNGSGRVKNAEVVVNSRTQRSKGFAFVTMMSVDEAKKAVADLNAKDFMGRPLVVGGAKPMPPRESRDEYSHSEGGEHSHNDESDTAEAA